MYLAPAREHEPMRFFVFVDRRRNHHPNWDRDNGRLHQDQLSPTFFSIGTADMHIHILLNKDKHFGTGI